MTFLVTEAIRCKKYLPNAVAIRLAVKSRSNEYVNLTLFHYATTITVQSVNYQDNCHYTELKLLHTKAQRVQSLTKH